MSRRRFRPSTLRRAWKDFGFAFAGQKWKTAKALAGTILVTVLDLAKPWPAAIVIDRILGRGLAGTPAIVGIVFAGGVTVLLSWIVGVLEYRATVTAAEVGRTATARVRRKVFDHLHRLSLPFHSSSKVGDLLVRLTGDVTLVRDLLFTSWLNLADLILQLIALMIIIGFLDATALVVLLVPLINMILMGTKSTGRLRNAVRKQRKSQGRTAALAAETLTQIRVVKAFGAEDLAAGRFEEDVHREEKEGLRAAEIAAEISRNVGLLSGIGGGLVLMVGAFRVTGGDLSIGELVVLISYAKSFFRPLRKVSAEMTRVAKASAVTERILDLLAVEPEDQTSGIPAPPLVGDIEIKSVSYSYPGGRRLLDNANVRIAGGSMVALIGPNGVGKSTLLGLLLRLVDPATGLVSIGGSSIEDFQLGSYRQRIAYVPQDLRLFSGTIADNIRFGRPDATMVDIERAANLALLKPVLDRFENGLDTEMGEGGETLSGGEARRLMLARAAIRESDLLLLDEPFAGLDPEARPAVARSIRTIAAGRTTIVVSHTDLDDLEPDLVISLQNGALFTREIAYGFSA